MELKDIQKQVDDFEAVQKCKVAGTWKNQSAEYGMLLLIEELGEVAKEIRRFEYGRYGHDEKVSKEENVQNIKDELGDVVIAISKVANKYGIDLGEAFTEKFAELQTRKFD
jgi:NTP pyrophosphatase (non-canonical NTP hydrolase)